MNAFNLILLSLGLSADAFAVSVTNGLCVRPPYAKKRFLTALCFGVFQGGMPVLGFWAGQGVAEFVAYYAHWVALILLSVLGAKTIGTAMLQKRRSFEQKPRQTMTGLLLQAVATSIDALSVGIGYAIIGEPIFPDAIFIGIVTFFCCFMGFSLGRRFGSSLAEKAMMTGGILLIFIGFHLFISHYFPFLFTYTCR